MSLPELAGILAERGIKLSLRLVIDAPSGAITTDVGDALEEHKTRIMAALANERRWSDLKVQRWAEPGTAEDDAEYERAERAAIRHEAS